jgi:ABC-2 type transport system permease protein
MAMFNAFKSEWIKVRRRAVLIGGVSMSVFSALFVPLGIIRATSGHFGGLPIIYLNTDKGLTTVMSRGVTLTAVIALIIVASATAAEYTHGTLRNLLVRQPHRLELLIGKFLGLLSYVFIAATIAFGVGIIAGLIVAPGHGVDTSAWTSAGGLSTLLSLYGELLFAVLGYSLLGFFSAVLFQSAAAAVAVPLAYIIIVENLIGAVWTDAPQWLFGQLVSSVINHESLLRADTGTATFSRGLTLGVIYMIAFAIVTGALFRFRDVTS